MKNLVFSELNKIMCRRSAYITLIISFIFVFFVVFVFGIFDYQITDLNGNTHKGLEAISINKKEFKELQNKNLLPKTLTDSEIKQTINNLKTCNKKQLNATQIKQYLYLLNNNYQLSTTSDPTKLFELSESKIPDFYKTREMLITEFLKDSHVYAEKQKTFWLLKSKQCDIPYTYGYYSGWMDFLDRSGFFIFITLAICIAVAPVYSNEYQSGMDSIILASKYGKTKNNIAKIWASFIFATVIITFSLFLCLGVTLAILGTEGWNLPLQNAQTYIAYPYNFLQVTLITIGIIYIATFVMVALTLLLSSLMKTPFPVLIVIVSILILPILFNSETKWLYLLPCKLLIGSVWYQYLSFSLFGKIFDIYCVSALLYMLLIVLLVHLTINIFKNHQVN